MSEAANAAPTGPHRITGLRRGTPFAVTCDGVEITAFPGETLATALLAAGVAALRRSEGAGAPRSVFCGMGVCFDCRVTVDGRPNRRACLTQAAPGQQVRTQGLRG